MLPLLDYNANYNSFSEKANYRIFLYGIYDEIELDDDLANELAKDLLLSVLRDNMDDLDSIVTFSQYMKLISAQTKSFIYECTLN